MLVNIIIDGNYLLYRQVFILKKLRRIKQDLKELLLNDFKKLSKSFPFDNLYFVSDSRGGNWRKTLYKDYKGKREKDETIDWDFVYETYEEVKDIIKNLKQVKYLELPGLEGDDFIAHIVKETNEQGYSNVIIASDVDINQVLKFDLNKKFINIQWNYKFSDERLYLPENYQLAINHISNTRNENIFELDNSSDFIIYVENLMNRTKTKSIIAEEFAFCKLLQGDKGDNIPTCVKVKDCKMNDDGRGIGKDGSLTVYKLYKEIHPNPINIDSDTFINNLVDVIIYYKKIKDTTAKDIIRDNLIFNRTMMILDPKYMPTITFDNMKNHFNLINNRVIDHTIENLESKLENEDFFKDVIKEDIPEQFRMEKPSEDFDPDSFWNLDEDMKKSMEDDLEEDDNTLEIVSNKIVEEIEEENSDSFWDI